MILSSFLQQQDKIILQLKAQDFYRNIFRNTTPTMKTYVDDIHSSFLKTMTTSSSQNVQIKPALSENTFKVPTSKELLAIQSPRIFPMLDVPTIIDEDKQVNIHDILDSLVNDFPQSVNITSTNLTLSFCGGNLPSFEQLACSELFVKRSIPKVTPTIDASALLHQFFSETKSPKRRVQKTKFCFPLFRFLLPGERLEDFVNPELNKGWLPPEITYPVDESLNNTLHGNSNGEAGSST